LNQPLQETTRITHISFSLSLVLCLLTGAKSTAPAQSYQRTIRSPDGSIAPTPPNERREADEKQQASDRTPWEISKKESFSAKSRNTQEVRSAKIT
jgi:hypothetical protein